MIATAQMADYPDQEQHGFEAGTEGDFGARTLCGVLISLFSAVKPAVEFGSLPSPVCPTCGATVK